eukprot:1158820-Pelagomonas_calceolata.AAC.5
MLGTQSTLTLLLTNLAQEKSFAEFARRPENQHLVLKAQQEEIKKKLRADERLRFLEFKEKKEMLLSSQAEAAGLQVVQALEPYLHHPVLMRVVTSFANGPEGSDIATWACNPSVQAILLRAKQLLEDGTLDDKELEYHILQHLKVRRSPPGGV